MTGVAFDAGTSGVSFDNAVGLGGTTNPAPMISALSVVGVNGAFLSPTGETGSPGTISSVPEPGTLTLLAAMGLGLLAYFVRRRKAVKGMA